MGRHRYALQDLGLLSRSNRRHRFRLLRPEPHSIPRQPRTQEALEQERRHGELYARTLAPHDCSSKD